MLRKRIFLFFLLLSFNPILQAAENKPTVITTLFPIYDFARQVGQDKISVVLLLPPGVEAHSFEPSAGDVVKVAKADIFIYTSRQMEPWVEKFIRGIDNKKLVLLEAGGDFTGNDPHTWLDFTKAMIMVDHIRDALAARDPVHREFYLSAAASYNKKLAELDTEYQRALSGCQDKVLIQSGHFAFGYLAQRYHLKYIAAYKGLSPDAEPTPRNLAELVDTIRQNKVKYIFYEELVSPRVAETLAQETGVRLLELSAAHNVSREELDRRVTFIDIMKVNLKNLKLGLSCP
ncbi:MAG: zinc ABC transporter substrate-binding protein [bacterium]|nr:zinc ABC transporter substrate-binding protein [bacterium]